MIQDIAPHKLNNQYGQKKAPDAGSRFLYYDGRKVLVRKGTRIKSHIRLMKN